MLRRHLSDYSTFQPLVKSENLQLQIRFFPSLPSPGSSRRASSESVAATNHYISGRSGLFGPPLCGGSAPATPPPTTCLADLVPTIQQVPNRKDSTKPPPVAPNLRQPGRIPSLLPFAPVGAPLVGALAVRLLWAFHEPSCPFADKDVAAGTNPSPNLIPPQNWNPPTNRQSIEPPKKT